MMLATSSGEPAHAGSEHVAARPLGLEHRLEHQLVTLGTGRSFMSTGNDAMVVAVRGTARCVPVARSASIP